MNISKIISWFLPTEEEQEDKEVFLIIQDFTEDQRVTKAFWEWYHSKSPSQRNVDSLEGFLRKKIGTSHAAMETYRQQAREIFKKVHRRIPANVFAFRLRPYGQYRMLLDGDEITNESNLY